MEQFLKTTGLSIEAQGFINKVWTIIQYMDDVYDKDTPETDIYAMCKLVLAYFPADLFYQRHMQVMVPALLLMVDKWHLANNAEENNAADAKSYMWRAGFYDILATAMILEGLDATQGLTAYGETFEDYMKEMSHA